MFATINKVQMAQQGCKMHEDGITIEDGDGNFVEAVAWWADNPIATAMAAADKVVSYYHSHGLPCVRVVMKKGQEIYRSMTA